MKFTIMKQRYLNMLRRESGQLEYGTYLPDNPLFSEIDVIDNPDINWSEIDKAKAAPCDPQFKEQLLQNPNTISKNILSFMSYCITWDDVKHLIMYEHYDWFTDLTIKLCSNPNITLDIILDNPQFFGPSSELDMGSIYPGKVILLRMTFVIT